MIFMLVLGILIGVFIPFTNPFLRSFTKILLIPLVVALGYGGDPFLRTPR